MLQLTWRRAAAWRIQRQYLHERAPAGSVLRVASRLCGLHAQLMSSAELTAWARVERLHRGDVQRALWEDRALVKTWAMRGTLHLLPANELPLWHGVLATSRRYLKPALWLKYFGLTMEELEQLTEAVGAALDGRMMTREELARAVGSNLNESSWGTVLKPAAFSGDLCFAPSLGTRVRFTRPHSWLAGVGAGLGPPVAADVATTEITRRFLGVYGPATYHDLARWWSGGGISIARQWIASLGEDAIEVEIDGVRAWMLAKHARKIRDIPTTRSVRLLPAFDQYVVAASHHAHQLLPGDLRARVYRPQGWISPVLLVNGMMHGVWKHELKGSRVEVEIEPFVKVPAWVRRAAAMEAERLAAFFGGSLSLAWKD